MTEPDQGESVLGFSSNPPRRKKSRKPKLDPELERQFEELMAQTQTSPDPLVQENARVLAERMDQFKAGKIKAEQVKATIDIQKETLEALVAIAARDANVDRTPNLHETEVALKLLEIGLKILL
jgi:gamma-glutamyl:cysteine ligase YbdK (ATP-grasp superfamily)